MESNTIKEKGYDNALKFHRDFDGNRFLKHFIEKQTPKFLDNGYSLYNYLSSINTNFDTCLPNIPCYFPNQFIISRFIHS